MTKIRPGSNPGHKYRGQDYVMGLGGEWDGLRKSDAASTRWESEFLRLEAGLERALDATRVALVMAHGGHVDKGLLAGLGMDDDAPPARVADVVASLVPKPLSPV